MGGRDVEVISNKGCSRIFVGSSSPLCSFRGTQPLDPMSPASSSLVSEPEKPLSNGPFAGLIICVTGLSKEARNQVMEATERLGGRYSPNLNPQCTHLVVQSSCGRKFDHALQHGSRNGLFVVTIGWFVDSVKRNVKMSESRYSVKGVEENGSLRLYGSNKPISGSENSCLPFGSSEKNHFDEIGEQHPPNLSGQSLYIDKNISIALRNKVAETAAREGASLVDNWFVGCSTDHVVCERTSIRKYLGHSSSLVTELIMGSGIDVFQPIWVLKTAKEKRVQKLVHISADLARQVAMMLEDSQNDVAEEARNKENGDENDKSLNDKTSQPEREQLVNSAKYGVRNRRTHRMQTSQIPTRPLSPSNLLGSVCWSISEPTSSASVHTDSFSGEDVSGHRSNFFDAKGFRKDSEASFANSTRMLTESEKSEVILKTHFLTILFPVDRFSEMGPSSRTFFSKNGFTCLQVLDNIHAFYQEKMSIREVEAAIHTDSKHADKLRAAYSSRAAAEQGHVNFKRVDFLGSRKSFETLKRVLVENNSHVYELLIRA